jgi:hypothetical protein
MNENKCFAGKMEMSVRGGQNEEKVARKKQLFAGKLKCQSVEDKLKRKLRGSLFKPV